MKINVKATFAPKFTHQGAVASRITPEQELRRSVMSCLLWENTFYESGISIADRIKALIKQVDPLKVSKIAVEAREKHGLRHVPLLIVREMARLTPHSRYVSRTLQRIITRPDQMAEFLALYWKDKKEPLSAKVKQGLAHTFPKFSEYQLAKYDRAEKVKLRDVLFLCHAKPKDEEQAEMWKRLIDGKLTTPDTWEVALSAGADKKETFERLMRERKLGALAYIRNLRNMWDAKVDPSMIHQYGLASVDVTKIFPWQFIAAAKTNPQLEPMIEAMMFKSLAEVPQFKGKTVVMIDNSGSMTNALSAKSGMSYIDAACGLAILLRELSEDCHFYSFSVNAHRVPTRRGFALRDAIQAGCIPSATYIGQSVNQVLAQHSDITRLIVITDEQSADKLPPCNTRGYFINVAANQNGIGYGNNWSHIDGFSASTLDWLQKYEAMME